MGQETSPLGWKWPRLLYAYAGYLGGPGEVIPGQADIITVIEGIDIYAGGHVPGAYAFVQDTASTAAFFYATAPSTNAWYAGWRGYYPIANGYSVSIAAYESPVDFVIWGHYEPDLSS